MNLNRYSGSRSCIPWHSDNESLFGPQNAPKLIVSMSLGNSVEFKVRRRGQGNVPSLITLDHGDLLVMDGLTQSEYVHCTASGLQGPRVNLTFRWVSQHIASCPLAGAMGCVLPSCVQGLAEPGPRGGENKWSSSWGWVLLLLILVSVLLIGTLINIRRGHRHSGQRPSRSAVHFPSRGRARWVGGRRWPLSRRRRTSKGVSFYFPCISFGGNMMCSFFKSIFLGICIQLGMLVAKWVPTPCYNDAYSVGTPKWALWRKNWLKYCKTMIPPFLGRFFLVSKRTFFFFWGSYQVDASHWAILRLVSCLLNLSILVAGLLLAIGWILQIGWGICSPPTHRPTVPPTHRPTDPPNQTKTKTKTKTKPTSQPPPSSSLHHTTTSQTFSPREPLFFLWILHVKRASGQLLAARDSAARRRRERRLRSWLKHERLTVAMALAECLHHSAQRPEKARAREVEEQDQHEASRRQKAPPPEKRGRSLLRRCPSRRHTGVGFELVLDPVVPQLGREDERQVADERVELVAEHTGKTCFWNPVSNTTSWSCR